MENFRQVNGAGEVSPEEGAWMRDDLDSLFQQVQARKAEADENKQRISAEMEQRKKKILTEIFSYLQDMGVDMRDLNSIGQFLQQLERNNPDLVEMFQGVIDACYGQEEGTADTAPDLMRSSTTDLQNKLLRE